MIGLRFIALWLAPICAFAVDPVTIVIEAGAGGNIREGAMSPITVSIENLSDHDLDGTIGAEFLGYAERWARPAAIQDLELAAGARKRITLYVQAGGSDSKVEVRYTGKRGRQIAKHAETVTTQPRGGPMLAIIGTGKLGLPPDESPNGDRTYYRTYYLQPALVPPLHEGLEMFDAIVIAPSPVTSLSAAQVSALREWTLRGGILIVDASKRTDGIMQAELASMLPFVPQATTQELVDPFGKEIVRAVGTVAEDASILLGTSERPLAARRTLGLGAVTALAFPPDDSAFLAWTGRENFWKETLDTVEWDSTKEDDPYAANEILAGITQSLSDRPDSGMRLGLVLVLVVLYILAAGPGDYFLVRKLRRPRMTWITFPLIVLIFTVLAYFGASWWIGGDWEMHYVQRTLILPDDKLAIRTGLTNVFVPATGEYRIASANGAFFRPLTGSWDSDPLTFDQAAGQLVQRIPLWTERVYMTSESVEGAPGIEVAVAPGLDAPGLSIRNQWTQPVQVEAVFAAESMWLPVKRKAAINPGEDTVVELGPKSRANTDFNSAGFGATIQMDTNELGEPVERTRLVPRFIDRTLPRPDAGGGFARELSARGAMKRGAYVVSLIAPLDTGSPIEFEGIEMISLEDTQIVHVVVYPREGLPPSEGPAAEEQKQ